MDFLKDIFEYKNGFHICGLTKELNVLNIINYFNKNDKNILVVTSTLYEANQLFLKLKTYNENICLFPMDDFLSTVALAVSPDLKVKRLETIEYIKHNKTIIVTNLMGYLKYLPSLNTFSSYNIELKVDNDIDRDELIKKLDYIGYRKESLVTTTGEYAVRGFIIDIFPIEATNPLRIELFGDTIESIREFDVDSQLSLSNVKNVNILPFNDNYQDNDCSIVDYMNNPTVFYVDYNKIENEYNKIQEEIKEYNETKNYDLTTRYMNSLDDIHVSNYMYVETINNYSNAINYNSKPMMNFQGNYLNLKDYCLTSKKDHTVIICLSKEKQIDKISSLFNDVNINKIVDNSINIINMKCNEGFIFNKYIVISEYDIDDIKISYNYKNSYRIGRKIKNYNDLHVGDYVVHANHGIGIYGGIQAISRNDLIRDYIVVNYEGNDKIYIPVEKIDILYKYQDRDGVTPKINKLNSTSWAKTKMNARKKIKDISGYLLKLYAERAMIKAPIYHDFPEELVFASNFEFEETLDQVKCIQDIDNDLKSQVPMDRLLCGDVGFGKTEVAFRGIMKTVLNNHQVAYLCPTTLLSRQQYLSALERFKDFPVNIALLNRFTSIKEQNRIIEGLKKGNIDIVFGTHKLLNDKITYKNLGLLIIDEEQRFGVSHKEKIKNLKNNVNVLTLSATPIPRTLKMAMSGLRDFSIIDTPPVDRYPVQTYVIEQNDLIIKDAIYKELTRNGQIFILYNRVESINNKLQEIKKLVPEARVCYAHGQMDKRDLENVVTDFIDYKYDILLCTTIIETGIDMPNVNTLIIYDADNFGLSQLYQLRGRVGRSNRIAYAYLMYNKNKMLTETATKRLEAIKDFTELGSGYKIAMRDLSIRGAGDILGSEQAGFAYSIGIDLYTQMINEEIRKLKGEEVEEKSEKDELPLIEVDNHIKDEYVSDENLKIEIHKLINTIKDKETLNNVKKEIEDRFGKLDEKMIIYMHEEWFEKLAKKIDLFDIRDSEREITIILSKDLSSKIDGEKLLLISYNINPKFKLSYRVGMITISLAKRNLNKHFIYYIIDLLESIKDMSKNNS